MQRVAQLPGIIFEAEPRQPETILPRMDIAAFVGFAASGPLHIPVHVEDRARFRELFGGDITLAWDEERSAPQKSLLGGAVENFFQNGGRRCWVVRVGPSDMPDPRFKLNGLVPAGHALFNPEDPRYRQDLAEAKARSPGGWANEVIFDTVLQREWLSYEGFDVNDRRYEVSVSIAPTKLRAGDLLEIVFGSEQPKLYLFLDAIEAMPAEVRLSGSEAYWYRPVLTSLPASEGSAWELINEAQGLDAFRAWQASGSPELTPRIFLLRFEIRTFHRGNEQRIRDLAFHRDHPRAWMHLPDDASLFQLNEGPRPQAVEPIDAELRQKVSLPRFPLAGPDQFQPSYLPLGMRSTPAELSTKPTSVRVDIDSDISSFSADLFIEDKLKGLHTVTLLREAEHRYYLLGESLQGLHSLLPVEEITLISIPDAVHRDWRTAIRDGDAPDPFPAPRLDRIPAQTDTYGRYKISWSRVTGATAYRLQHDSSPEFSSPITINLLEGATDTNTDLKKAHTLVDIALDNDCAVLRFFRVRALRRGITSPWSETRGGILPAGYFMDCIRRPIAEILLEQAALGLPPGQKVRLRWALLTDGADFSYSYELQVASDLEFASARQVYAESESEFVIDRPVNAPLFYRVRAHRAGDQGPWSNTVVIEPQYLQIPRLESPSDYDAAQLLQGSPLLAIHRALIRFCAARGDVWACLSLPRHYRRQQVLNYLRSLSVRTGRSRARTADGVPPLNLGEANALSYAGLFHPWLGSRRDDVPAENTGPDLVLFGPPDGAVLGWMARQAIVQGVWYAPANEPFKDAIALASSFSNSDRRELTQVGVNLVRLDPRGLLLQNAVTLHLGNDLRQINVRRLLILLRRLALREGKAYLFEPNSADFRGLVQHRFEQLLSQLYVRGAFAGSTPASGYRVVVDDSVNPRQSLDQGRFVIELRVAPSQPLQFITIRLIHTGSERFELEEI